MQFCSGGFFVTSFFRSYQLLAETHGRVSVQILVLRIMRKLLFIGVLLFSFGLLGAQNEGVWHVEPPNWWVGMKNQTVQLLIHGVNIALTDVSVNSDMPYL